MLRRGLPAVVPTSLSPVQLEGCPGPNSPQPTPRTGMLMLLSSSAVGKGSGVFPLKPNLDNSPGVCLETDSPPSYPTPALSWPDWSKPWTWLPWGAPPPFKAAPAMFGSGLPASLTGGQYEDGTSKSPSLSHLLSFQSHCPLYMSIVKGDLCCH